MMNMKTFQDDEPLVGINSIGEAAFAGLTAAPEGSVLASVSNAVYLLSRAGELCWLAPKSIPMHRRGVQVAAALPRWNIGSVYVVDDLCYLVCSGNKIDLHSASLWKPPVSLSTEIVPFSNVCQAMRSAVDCLLAGSSPSGFGSLINQILPRGGLWEESTEAEHQSLLMGKVWPLIRGMMLAERNRDARRMIHDARALIGLGEGMTPSGDDFLGGYIFSKKFLNQNYSSVLTLPFCTYINFIQDTSTATNLISYTILKDHADGHTVEPLHWLAEALIHGQPVDQLVLLAKKLISLGHSTGWDVMTGFFAGLCVTTER